MRKISVVRMDGKRTKNESGIMRKITRKIMVNYYTLLINLLLLIKLTIIFHIRELDKYKSFIKGQREYKLFILHAPSGTFY
jgi:hypothetical protein